MDNGYSLLAPLLVAFGNQQLRTLRLDQLNLRDRLLFLFQSRGPHHQEPFSFTMSISCLERQLTDHYVRGSFVTDNDLTQSTIINCEFPHLEVKKRYCRFAASDHTLLSVDLNAQTSVSEFMGLPLQWRDGRRAHFPLRLYEALPRVHGQITSAAREALGKQLAELPPLPSWHLPNDMQQPCLSLQSIVAIVVGRELCTFEESIMQFRLR